MNTKLVGIDLAKNVFQICAMDDKGNMTINKKVTRRKLASEVVKLAPEKVVMESCYTANDWGRRFQSYGFEVGAIPAQFVKPFVRGNKNDANDALAIVEAAQRPGIRWVPIKTLAQQDIQSLHRIRQRHVEQKTALANQLRGLLSEYGIVIPRTVSKLKLALPDLLEDADNGLSIIARQFVAALYTELKDAITRIEHDEKALQDLMAGNEDYQRLMEIPGFGPIISSALIAAVGNASQFNSGRQLAAWTGLTPRQHASGENTKMGAISKRGNRYLRTLFIHGARAAFSFCKKRDHHILQWADQVAQRHGKHKACVALANKLARIAWVILTKKTHFETRPMKMI